MHICADIHLQFLYETPPECEALTVTQWNDVDHKENRAAV